MRKILLVLACLGLVSIGFSSVVQTIRSMLPEKRTIPVQIIVMDENGTVSDAMVMIYLDEQKSQLQSAETDHSGTARFTVFSTGRYCVCVERPNQELSFFTFNIERQVSQLWRVRVLNQQEERNKTMMLQAMYAR